LGIQLATSFFNVGRLLLDVFSTFRFLGERLSDFRNLLLDLKPGSLQFLNSRLELALFGAGTLLLRPQLTL
jgi:hypothetical protein